MSQENVEAVKRGGGQRSSLRLGYGVLATASLLLFVAPAEAAFPGRNGRIAVDSGLGAFVGVFSLRPNGTGLRRVAAASRPGYSRSGRMLAFGCTEQVVKCPPGVGIRIKRADGRGGARRLTRNGDDDYPDWSPDGRRIVFTRYPTPAPDAPVGSSGPEPELWIYHRGHSRRLTVGETPAWSIRREIAFVRDDFERGSSIYTIRPDGSRLRRIANGLDPQWSPSGRRLVYDRNLGLYTIGRTGHRRRRLASFGTTPDYSPDGRWVVFVADSNDTKVAVMRTNRTRRRTIFRSRDGYLVSDPDWGSLTRRARHFVPCPARATQSC